MSVLAVISVLEQQAVPRDMESAWQLSASLIAILGFVRFDNLNLVVIFSPAWFSQPCKGFAKLVNFALHGLFSQQHTDSKNGKE